MGFIDNVCPSALEMPSQKTKKGAVLESKTDGPTCIFVFKTIIEPHIGELSLFKVYSGSIKEGMELVNETTGVTEKINQIYVLEGNERIPVKELAVGDIGATIKLKHTHVNNTLHTKGQAIELEPIDFPNHNMTVAIEAVERGQEEKLAQALHTLMEEDATVDFEVSSELKQTLLHCMGELHLKTIEWKLNHIHGVNVRFEQPRIPYRETITGTADAMYRHKKQSGGSGQFGEVTLRVEAWKEGLPEPTDVNVRNTERIDLPWGGKLEFKNCIVGGAIDARFIPSVLKGIMSVMEEGPLTGSYVRDVRVLLYDGKMHPVDSNDISFKIAGAQAFKAAFQLASPQLLEPVHQVVVLCSDDQVGSVMGDLQTRKGIVEGMEAEGSFQKITAKVPLVQLHNYSSALRGLTHGRARFSSSFAQYAPVDYETQEGLVKQHQRLATVEVGM